MPAWLGADRRLDDAPHLGDDEIAGRLIAAIEIDRRHDRLEHPGHQRRRQLTGRGHPFAKNQEFVQSQAATQRSASLPTDDDRLDLGEVPFQVLGEPLVEQLADDQGQDGVAEKLEALVGLQAMRGPEACVSAARSKPRSPN